MATFYATIKGNRGPATRMGSKASGIKAAAQSWNGSVITSLNYNQEGQLMVNISTDEGSSSLGQTIFYGTFEEFKNRLRG